MTTDIILIVPLAGAAILFGQVGRRDPARRARKEAAWRDMIRSAGIAER